MQHSYVNTENNCSNGHTDGATLFE